MPRPTTVIRANAISIIAVTSSPIMCYLSLPIQFYGLSFILMVRLVSRILLNSSFLSLASIRIAKKIRTKRSIASPRDVIRSATFMTDSPLSYFAPLPVRVASMLDRSHVS